MKFLVVGLGSMGKRRIRNLTYLKAGEIIGFDVRADRREEATHKHGIVTYADFDMAMAQNPEALVISTPPDLHAPYALAAARAGKAFFTEASVVDDGMDELIALCARNNAVAAPSCTMRFFPAIQTIKKLVDEKAIGKALSFTYHVGQYLPDWHPWEDYRNFYVAKRATGAAREIVPFELAWLTWAFGRVVRVSAQRAKLTELDADIDDIYQLQLAFDTKVLGQLQVDVIARVAYRTLRVLSESGVIEWNAADRLVRVYKAATGAWTEYPEPPDLAGPGFLRYEGSYVEEMQTYINAAQRKAPWPYPLSEDKAVLDVLQAAERSSDADQHIRLAGA